MSGIYIITCISNGLVYIGQSVDVAARYKEHLKKLKGQRHPNYKLQKDFNEMGLGAFSFNIICSCEESELNTLEQKYIKEYNSIIAGYNLKDGGSNGRLSQCNRLKRRMERKGKKPVFGYDISGVLLKSWVSIKECAQELKANPCDVRRTMRQEQRICKGYILTAGVFEPMRPHGVLSRQRNEIGRFIK